MATAAARKLTDVHRAAQVRIGVDAVRLVVQTFPLLDPGDIDGSFRRWLDVTAPIVQRQRARSAQLAAGYVTAYRAIELGLDVEPFTVPAFTPAPAEQLATSLLVTGPYALRRRLARGDAITKAIDMTMASSSGAGMRLALEGGRRTILDSVRSDDRAVGYERITSGRGCDFCSMLAGRGAVYGEESADFAAHDHCTCSAAPVYR